MRLVHKMIQNLSKASELFEQFDFHIHEIHHEKKGRRPSGTASLGIHGLVKNHLSPMKEKSDTVGDPHFKP